MREHVPTLARGWEGAVVCGVPTGRRMMLLGWTWGDCPRLVWSCAVGAQEGSVVGRGRVQSLAAPVLVRRGRVGSCNADSSPEPAAGCGELRIEMGWCGGRGKADGVGIIFDGGPGVSQCATRGAYHIAPL